MIQAVLAVALMPKQDGLARATMFANKLTSAAGVQAKYRLEIDHKPAVSGYVARRGAIDFDFTAKAEGMSYQYTVLPRLATEFDHIQKEYYEFGPNDALYFPDGKFSTVPMSTIPPPFISPGIKQVFSSNKTKFEPVGNATESGVPCVHYKLTAGQSSVDAWFADKGQLMRYEYEIILPSGSKKYFAFWFSDYSDATSPFEVEPANGYSRTASRRFPYPIPIGRKFPADNWVTAAGAHYKLAADKPTLFIITSESCAISPKVMGLLSVLGSKVRAVAVSSNGKVPAGLKTSAQIKSTKGSILERLGFEGTPSFVLVNKAGKVAWIYQGFQSEQAKALAKEILAQSK